MKRVLIILICVLLLMSMYGCGNDKNPSTDTNNNYISKNTEPTTSSTTTSVSDTNKEERKYLTDLGTYEEYTYDAVLYYYISSSAVFEEGDSIEVDSVINYFRYFEVWDENARIKDIYKQYLVSDKTGETMLCIPQSIVNDKICEHFSVELICENSIYTHPDKEGYYLLDASARGYDIIAMKNIRTQENNVIVDSVYANAFTYEIYVERELCIEKPDSKGFRIIYARDIANKPIHSDETTE